MTSPSEILSPDQKVRPILFSAPMVRALLAGTKTQTRRIVTTEWNHGFKPSKHFPYRSRPFVPLDGADDFVTFSEPYTKAMNEPVWFYSWGNARWLRCPYGKPGDLLWVRETFARVDGQTQPWIATDYRATYKHGDRMGDHMGIKKKWTPAIHMPRHASRLTLRITDVRVERLQKITEDDARAEGTQEPSLLPIIQALWSERAAYAKLWEHINGKGSWDVNPWVWVVSFERVESAKAAA